MATLSLKSLVGKLMGQPTRALEAAAGCVCRVQIYNVEIEHWLSKILEQSRTDIHCILKFRRH